MASNIDQADRVLGDRGVHALSIKVESGTGLKWRVPRDQLAVVFRSIATLFEAGLTLPAAIEVTEGQVAIGRLKPALADIRRLVLQGEPLADAVGLCLPVPQTVVGLLRIGEKTGQLRRVLNDAASQLESEAASVSDVQRALAYPTILAVAGGGSLVLIVCSVLPRFTGLLLESGQELPLVTKLVLGGAALLGTYGWMFVVGVALSVAVTVEWIRRTNRLSDVYSAFLSAPFIGPIRFSWIGGRLARMLESQLGSGVPLLRAIESARSGIGDPCIQLRIDQAIADISRGVGIAAAFREAKVLPAKVLPLLEIGERSGYLVRMLSRCGEICSTDASRRLEAAIRIIEPTLVITFGVAVAILAAAMLEAVYAVRP